MTSTHDSRPSGAAAPVGAPDDPTMSMFGDDADTLPDSTGAGLDAGLAAALRDASGRFVFQRQIGVGGFGEVWEAWDARLGRTVAIKLLRPRWGADGRFVDLLREEARVASQLIHPAIVAVHDLGILEDGSPFIVMEHVDGFPWHQVFPARPTPLDDAREALSAYMNLVEGLAFGHAREVAHRDIKPGNVLVSRESVGGGAGVRVRIVDWGLACLVDDPESEDRFKGQRAGTPAYTAPELRDGGKATLVGDVYSAGVILHELIWGVRPDPTRPSPGGPARLGDRDLARICQECLRPDPRRRIPTANALLTELQAWWRGWLRREEVAQVLEQADRHEADADMMRRRCRKLRADAEALEERIHPSAPEADKLGLWSVQDDLAALESDLHRVESDRMASLLGALAIDPRSRPVRLRLAELHRQLHTEADARGDSASAARHLAALATFDDGTHAAYLKGTGSVEVRVEAPRARVLIRRLDTHRRRLEVGKTVWTGRPEGLPATLAAGRYHVQVTAPGRHLAEFTLRLRRSQRWRGRPASCPPLKVHLPDEHAILDEEVYVCAGPAIVGSDLGEHGALPAREVWVDAFAVRRRCVTVGEYIEFLDDLVAKGLEDTAMERSPQQRGAADDVPLYLLGRHPDGSFFPRPDADGDPVYPDHPVTLIRPRDAEAYAAWLSERSGLRWRLPFELEWEKAARSADGRVFPMGDHCDASWVRCLQHHAPDTRLRVARVTEHPHDRSPYGVEQMAGNVFEMTASEHNPAGPRIGRDGTWAKEAAAVDAQRVLRGGAWGRDLSRCAAVHRTVFGDHRSPLVGFRLVRDLA